MTDHSNTDLSFLGNGPALSDQAGSELHTEIISGWTAYLKKSLSLESRKGLMDKFLIKKNATTSKKPKW